MWGPRFSPASSRSLLPCSAAAMIVAASIFHEARAAVCDGISTAPEAPLTTVRVASGLVRPLLATSPPGDTFRLFIVLQDGIVRLMKNGTMLGTSFLDISALTRSPADVGGGNEEGLLGLAFRPDYDTSGVFFVYHTDSTGANNLVVRYLRSAGNPDVADPNTRQVALTIPHPSWDNHNGGMLAFGPDDGYLYIGTGDGGGSCDSTMSSQTTTSNKGKILRLDVSSLPYSIPPSNPFVGPDGTNDEIWSLGLRNPWRFSFDRLNADLYIADVGQGTIEELDYRPGTSPGGENYGWPKYEGDTCPNPSCGSANCVVSGLVLPIVQYGHTGGACSVTGGYVYRGCRMPALHGNYFYADYCAAFIRSFRVVGGSVVDPNDRTAELAPGGGLSIGTITSFGEDAGGEIYIVDRGGFSGTATGEVFKIVPVLSNLEVSGPGATSFIVSDQPASAWTWEDLASTSSHPISTYRVYRSNGRGNGTFDCIHETMTPSWTGGDPSIPALGSGFSYLVTALNASGQETSPGTGTGGSPRTLSCPP